MATLIFFAYTEVGPLNFEDCSAVSLLSDTVSESKSYRNCRTENLFVFSMYMLISKANKQINEKTTNNQKTQTNCIFQECNYPIVKLSRVNFVLLN